MNATISNTGFWDGENAHKHHVFSPELANMLTSHPVLFTGIPTDQSITDLGCGMGNYLLHLQNEGYTNLLGVEGDPPKNKVFDNIIKHDLTLPLQIDRRGSVICLEVLEHIPSMYEDTVIQNILKCFEKQEGVIILSWAIENQEGYGHVNCRNNDYVINKFKNLGFVYLENVSQDLRNCISDQTSWFRNTLMVFI